MGIGYHIEHSRAHRDVDAVDKAKQFWSNPEFAYGFATGVRADTRMGRAIPIGRTLFDSSQGRKSMGTIAEWLVNELDADLSVRRRELIDLRLLASSTTGLRNATISRSCVVMAYAHWEGFAKQTLRLYLDHLVKLRMKLIDLKYELQALALLGQMKSVVGVEKSILKTATLIKDLDDRGSELFSVDSKTIVRIGNLTSENLKLLLEFAALPYMPSYATRENFIDSTICGNRHLVAHGELLPISASDARGVVSDVLALCDELNNQIQTAAVYREYLA